MTWTPIYSITPNIARQLMEIEAARVIIERTPLSPQAQAELRRQARLRAAHYSTYIEGNLSNRKRAYGLSALYRRFIGALSAERRNQ